MLKVLYAGSPEAAALVLERLLELHNKDFKIVGVLTNPPSPQGRNKKLLPTPVEQKVRAYEEKSTEQIPVLTPKKLDAVARETVSDLQPDVLVCFAYGKIFGPKFLALFPLGGINLHPSLLPLYRGCAPVPAAILDRQSQTGVTVQKLAQKMDSGDILSQQVIPLNGTETADSLLEDSAKIGADMVLSLLHDVSVTGTLPVGTPQDDSQATYCTMLKKEDGCIDWSGSAEEIDAQIRAFNSWPGAFTCVDTTVLKIHKSAVFTGDLPVTVTDAMKNGSQPGQVLGTDKKQGILIQTGKGILCVTELQWQAKKLMPWKDFLNGSRNFVGSCCSSNTK